MAWKGTPWNRKWARSGHFPFRQKRLGAVWANLCASRGVRPDLSVTPISDIACTHRLPSREGGAS
jgi:hypothetical protein